MQPTQPGSSTTREGHYFHNPSSHNQSRHSWDTSQPTPVADTRRRDSRRVSCTAVTENRVTRRSVSWLAARQLTSVLGRQPARARVGRGGGGAMVRATHCAARPGFDQDSTTKLDAGQLSGWLAAAVEIARMQAFQEHQQLIARCLGPGAALRAEPFRRATFFNARSCLRSALVQTRTSSTPMPARSACERGARRRL